MNHEALRKRAVKWLTGIGCGVVLSEIVSACCEIPDAVGWKYGASFAVECKVSRSDFRANGDKPSERTGRGVGQYRYFMVPEGLIAPEELPGPEWGLLWCSPDLKRVRVQREPSPRRACLQDEVVMLTSALRRVKMREFLIIVSEDSTNEKAPEV